VPDMPDAHCYAEQEAKAMAKARQARYVLARAGRYLARTAR
jgi:hypothetical protein